MKKFEVIINFIKEAMDELTDVNDESLDKELVYPAVIMCTAFGMLMGFIVLNAKDIVDTICALAVLIVIVLATSGFSFLITYATVKSELSNEKQEERLYKFLRTYELRIKDKENEEAL